MKVALVQMPHFYGQSLSRPPSCYPLGLAYLSSMLSKHSIEHVGVNLWERQLTPQQAIDQIDFAEYDVIGISAYSTQYRYLKELSLLLKKQYPRIPLLCGGPGPTFSTNIILRCTGVDVCVLAEGEITLVELLKNLHDIGSVKGIAYMRERQVIFNLARQQIKELDSLPFPNREFFNFESVLHERKRDIRSSCSEREYGEKRIATVIAGRGCPYRCTFCSKTFSGLRLRSIDNIVEEIKVLMGRYGIDHISFNDELVLVNKKRTLELCEKFKQLSITWDCQGRINNVDEEILKALKGSGCLEIGYGVESVSQEILDAMKKDIRAETIIPVVEMTRRMGIRPVIQYMFGYPGENDDTIRRTVEFFKAMDLPFMGSPTTPIPGSALYDLCIENGRIKDEEDYLLRLDSGYNLIGGSINLTGFSDAEFVRKHRRLQMRVDHNYLKKRPSKYISFVSGIAKRKIRNRIINLTNTFKI